MDKRTIKTILYVFAVIGAAVFLSLCIVFANRAVDVAEGPSVTDRMKAANAVEAAELDYLETKE